MQLFSALWTFFGGLHGVESFVNDCGKVKRPWFALVHMFILLIPDPLDSFIKSCHPNGVDWRHWSVVGVQDLKKRGWQLHESLHFFVCKSGGDLWPIIFGEGTFHKDTLWKFLMAQTTGAFPIRVLELMGFYVGVDAPIENSAKKDFCFKGHVQTP